MKSRISSIQHPIAVVLTSATLLASTTPGFAQDALIEKAKQACTEAAQAKGFELKEVLSSESTADGGATVVLDLLRNGASAKLTCKLSQDGKVISDDTATSGAASSSTTTDSTAGNPTEPAAAVDNAIASTSAKTYPGWLSPSWGWLIPLLGLPLLLLFAKRLHESGYPTHWGKKVSTVNIVKNSEVVVRHSRHEGTDVRSGPSANYPVTRHLQNGNRVTLTGRQEDHWVELVDGGWLPIEHLDLEPHLV